MAVIACPDCNGKVSDSAPACPHCGCKMTDQHSAQPSTPLKQMRSSTKGTQMVCEKCNTGKMARDKIYRLSGCLVTIGYTLWVPAVLVLIVTLAFTVFGVSATSTAASTTRDTAKKAALERLKNIPNIAQEVSREFESTGQIDQQTMSKLDEEQRHKVEEISTEYHANIAGTAIAAMGTGCVGGSVALLVYIAGIPAFIVGFLLTLRRSVWRCAQCAFVFDRA